MKGLIVDRGQQMATGWENQLSLIYIQRERKLEVCKDKDYTKNVYQPFFIGPT